MMKNLQHLILSSALGFMALTGATIKATASSNAGLHLNIGSIREIFEAHLVEYFGECPGRYWSGLAINGDIRFISRQTEPQKKLKVRLINLRTGKEIKRNYKKPQKGSNDFSLKKIGNEKGIHNVEYEIYHKDTEKILEKGEFRYEVTFSQETKPRNGNWQLELFCASNTNTPVEQCAIVGKREVLYCQGTKTNRFRNQDIVQPQTTGENYIPEEIAQVTISRSGFPQADSVKTVRYPGGVFVQSRDRWVETNDRGIYQFKEIGRDQWSIYLRATDRDNVKIQLDLWTEQVKYNGSFLYKIIHAR